jgi:hypothetical protein
MGYSSCGSLENLPRGIAPRGTHDAASGMAARATQVQARDRRLVLRRAGHGSDHEELVKGEIHVMPMSAGDPKAPLDIGRRQ